MGIRPFAKNDKKTKSKEGQIDPRLLEILICPITGGPLQYDRAANELISKKAKLAYAVREGVPIMLADEARVVE